MKTRSGIGVDRDGIVAQLAQLDSSDPADPGRSFELASSVRELKAELDTLIGELREPAIPDPFADETGLRRAQELVRAIGVEPETKVRDQRLELGRIGPYELLEKLGQGGMGAVYKALHSSLEKIVALKVLPRERLHAQAISRFKREMKAVGKLDHPNIVRATDAGEADGNHFLVMEYVDGVDLSELLRRVGPLAPADACELVRQAANGLQHAHQRRMVHRDIKPNNIMLSWSDEHEPAVKILDMGLALLSEPKAPAHGDLTTTGQMMGTVEYMSPEQGLDTHNVDIRSDIYSLGATLYKLLCGKAPFTGKRYNTPGKILVALATEQPVSIGTMRNDLPAGLVAVIDRMLAKDPAERYATPAEVAQALAPFTSCADLRRLADAARRGIPIGDTVDKSEIPTEEHLSLPITGTVTEDGAVRGSRDPADAVRGSHDPAPTADRRSPLGTSNEIQTTGDLRSVAGGSVRRPATALDGRLATTQVTAPAPRRHRVAVLTAIGLSLVGLVGILFGGQIIRIVTNKGQIVIETDGAGIEVVIKDGQGKVLDTETKREITFAAGEYNLEVTVKDSGGEQRFVTDHFVLSRNGRKTVDARWETAKPKPTAESSDPDRRAAEWVLSIGGSISIKDNGQERQVGAVGELRRGAIELASVDLHSNLMVSDADLAHFKDCKNLTGLYLHDTQVGDAGLLHFKNCKTFTHLALSHTKVSDVGLANFGDCKNLRSLILSSTQVSDTGLAYFRDCKNLEQLILPSTQVSDAGLAHFKDCKNLTTLNLRGTQLSDAGLVYLTDCENLTQLELGLTKVSDTGLAQFENRKNLAQLGLAGTKVSDAGLAQFRECKNLAQLDLSMTKVSDAGLAVFKDCKKLTALALIDTSLSDAGLAHFAGCPNLGSVFVTKTKVSEAGVKKLSAALPGCKIEWDGGVIEPTVAADPDRRAAEWALSIGGSINIKKNGQECQIKAVGDLPQDAFQLTVVDLSENQKVSDAELKLLEGLTKLEALNLSSTRVADAGLEHIKGLITLGSLDLRNTEVGDVGLAHLQALKDLWALDLNSTHVTGDGLRHLQGLSKLSHLFLQYTKLGDTGLQHLRGMTSLQRLNLGSVSITDADLECLANLRNLEILEVMGARISDAGVKHIVRHTGLRDLELWGCTLATDSGFALLKQLPALESLILNSSALTDASLEHIKQLSKLKTFHASNTQVTRVGMDSLRKALPNCYVVSDFHPNTPDRRAAQFVLSIGGIIRIQENGQEREIKAGDELPGGAFELMLVNLIQNPKVIDAGLTQFTDCKNLTTLNFAGTQVSDAGLFYFADCPKLGFVFVKDTKVTEAGVRKLSAALPKCKIEWDGMP